MREAARQADTFTSVGKALALLSAFGGDERVGVSELARRASLSKATAFRLLAILQDAALIQRDGTNYALGPRLFELGNLVSFCQPRSVRDIAHPFLEQLHEQTKQTIHLGVLDGTDVLYVDKLYGHSAVLSPSHVGCRLPAYCTAVGKAMLAHSDPATVRGLFDRRFEARTPYTIVLPRLLSENLARIRTQGVAYDREEAALGLTCVAAPILDHSRRVVAAVSVSGGSTRFAAERWADLVSRTARAIGSELTSETWTADSGMAARHLGTR